MLQPSPGCGERSAGGHSFYHECAFGVPHLLADLQHHGRQPICREVLLLRQYHFRWNLSHRRCQQQVRMSEFGQWQRPLEECQNQLWQRRGWLSGSAASGEFSLSDTLWTHKLDLMKCFWWGQSQVLFYYTTWVVMSFKINHCCTNETKRSQNSAKT